MVDDDDATIGGGDASDDANAHTTRGTGQYAPSGAHRHEFNSPCETIVIPCAHEIAQKLTVYLGFRPWEGKARNTLHSYYHH